jgi:hypothetical protein
MDFWGFRYKVSLINSRADLPTFSQAFDFNFFEIAGQN